ncbi:pentapeptide repeat-containing protein [uncultured Rothia sp.]|uniref:pentapeptide repeat-containing protein n=1 Tax=uncultured Rothia sp. TaxID=316088 RepID=UPI0025FD2719|nr:pentapeptide repeat-containing protein [uncultured Rothia sp.]
MPSNNASSIPESQVIPKAQENPWYIQHFTRLLIGFGLGGGAIALVLPWMLWLFCGMSSGSSDQLRLHLLYVTGGVIAVLTLLQTNWKNQGDRIKIDADIKKNEQDAEKNERDHIRQVHAERRSRYTKAVEQLADEKAAVRLGGIYTLVGLVDEWLADETLDPEEQQKEGQVIINNLCSYSRSPFPLAEKIDEYEARQELKELESKKPDTLLPDESSKLDTLRKRFEDSAEYQEPDNIAALQAAFHEEQDVRRAIFEEMSKRSSKVSMGKNKKVTVTPGTWSTFGFDFSRAPIFYPLNNLTIEQGNFVSARFYGEADFGGAKFAGAADFRDAKFAGAADFRDAKFAGAADFGGAEFTGLAYFDYAEFAGGHAEFDEAADFNNAKFTGNANFENAMFAGDADFDGAKFAGAAYFGEAEFAGTADFDGAKFARAAGFGNATFTENAYFSSAEFTEDAYFRGAKFSGKTSFEEAYFEKCAPIFADASNSARFSAQVDPQDYLFEEHPESPHGFSCGTAKLLNRTFVLPFGAVLYDPDSWDEEKQDYTRVSEPAQ